MVPQKLNKFESKLVPQEVFRKPQYGKDYNSYNYRCDEFVDIHKGSHILFSGCSVTFGEGLNKKELWSWMVNEELSKNINTSGYFNLAMPGASISFDIMKMFKYFNKFGNPDIIFFNMPPTERFFSVNLDEKTHTLDITSSVGQMDSPLDKESALFANAIHFESYNMLEAYCREAGIKLISFTWWEDTYLMQKGIKNSSEIFNSFETFYDIHRLYSFEKYLKKQIQLNFADKSTSDLESSILYARDGAHPGLIYHNFYKDAILNILDNNLYKTIERYQ